MLLVTGTVIFVLPKVWPDLAGLPVIWPVLLPLVGFLAALSRRSYLRYVRVRQV
ncbi:hypothetical protein ACIOHE_23675 [Streptomyces sp. NPDC087851]|uniref:hypothetical protein n=1 Tax=Streptomyces sp. NPDC087851 TaxID=3365810 RepID=UPI0038021997